MSSIIPPTKDWAYEVLGDAVTGIGLRHLGGRAVRPSFPRALGKTAAKIGRSQAFPGGAIEEISVSLVQVLGAGAAGESSVGRWPEATGAS